MIRLIINGDDFRLSRLFNEKILDLLDKGFIKSTSVMVNRITKEQDAQLEHLIKLNSRGISVGLHLDIDIEKPLRPQMESQYRSFVSIFGFQPSHIDVHKLVHSKEVVEEANSLAEKYNLPVRNHGIKANTKQTDYPAFSFSGWVFKLEEAVNFLRSVKDGSSCELITHPGQYDPDSPSRINKEREEDYNGIIKLQDFLKANNIENISYKEL
ncbi:MAG: ChbG/HpnK family deacetylase [Nanoarchaeota archaeon]|nr:ChbG/HpnK family deacetylase [Nanoarchaeota archaeon]